MIWFFLLIYAAIGREILLRCPFSCMLERGDIFVSLLLLSAPLVLTYHVCVLHYVSSHVFH